jgi:hypothetical protein
MYSYNCRFQVNFQRADPKFVANLPITFPSSKIGRELQNKVLGRPLDQELSIELLRGNFFQCHVFAMKSVQNLKSYWRSSQNYLVLALFSSL